MTFATKTRAESNVRDRASLDGQRAMGSYASWSDEELLLAYRDRAERDAFVELVHRYEKELYSYLRRYLDSATLAEDTFQTTFLLVHLKCDQFDDGRKVRPWLYAIATNQAIDAQRRNKRHRMVSLDRGNGRRSHEEGNSLSEILESGEHRPDDAVESSERRDQVRSAVKALPETLRRVVLLIYYQGMKYREAAEVLGLPVGTVKSRLHAAILKLNESWSYARPEEA